jgi:signal recognition particle subunit SRP54
MLEQLTSKLSRVVKTMRGQARLTDENMQEMLREVRVALLEADVALPVVRDFIARIRERALGEEVVGSLTPGQALVGVVQRELTQLIGGDQPEIQGELSLATQPPAVILLAGLQGAGKTTTAGKLARWLLQERKKKTLLVSTDVYRPAAIEQLRLVAEQAGAQFCPSAVGDAPLDIAARALEQARRQFFDVLIVDTAGRLAIDEAMMQEVAALEQRLQPIETLFVVDAMQGQDAVNTARAFADRLPLTGRPIKFVGVGEKLTGFERFNPAGMASRILGMGDILALVEDVKKAVDTESAQKFARRMQAGERFDLNDFREQVGQMRKMGGIASLVDKLPAQFAQAASQVNAADSDRQVRRIEGIIASMTPAERSKPELIKASRKRRIASGAGVPVQEVNRLLSQFEQMQSMMKQMKKGGLAKMMRGLGAMRGLPGLPKR